MRCVSYTRYVSSMPETETPVDTIRQQNKRITAFAKEHGWAVSRKYTDRKNNKNAEDAFLELKKDGMLRKFDIVIMDSFYRFGKSIAVGRNLLHEVFYPAGIHFAVAEDDFCSCGKTPEEVRGYFAKKYADYRIKLRWSATMDKREQGFFNVHDERYGYLLSEDHRQLVVDEEAAEVIRLAFKLMAEGMTMKQIARQLNEKGYEPPAIHLQRVSKKRRFVGESTEWTANGVKTIAESTAYIGKVTKKIRDEYVEYDIPRILDDELYRKACEERKRRYNGSARHKNYPNMLKHIIKDKDTGRTLICLTSVGDRTGRYFCLERKVEDSRIRYEEVIDQVIVLLNRESAQAKNVAAAIESAEGQALYQDRRQQIIRSMRRMMKNLSDVSMERIAAQSLEESEKNEIFSDTEQQMQRLEERFEKKLKELNDVETAFCNNPWINMYRNLNISEEIPNAEAKKLIQTVWVKNCRYVSADMMYQKWKRMLPCRWRKGDYADGQKEQEEL